jgi:pimeloyl-ACP methyl ester carboxylesterase
MTQVLELAKLASAIYTGETTDGWQRIGFRAAWQGWLSDGLQAGVYKSGSQSVVAFRGTNISWRVLGAAQDLVADLTLGLGANSAYYAAAETFVSDALKGSGGVVLTGHSLGGAVAQVIGNRLDLPFATFNAPGVAVVASRNIAKANPFAANVRIAGMVASAVAHPVQAYQDMKAAFTHVRGLNICLDLDQVSKIGLHYGEEVTIPSKERTGGLLAYHSILNVIASLELPSGQRYAQIDSSDFR